MMRRLWTLLSVVLLTTTAWAQTATPPWPYTLNRDHPALQGLRSWHLVLPQLRGGSTWANLMGPYPGTLTNMATTDGFVANSGTPWGAVRCDGVNDVVNLGTASVYDFANTTVSIQARLQTTVAATQYVLSRRDFGDGNSGAWYIRTNADGTLSAALRGNGNNAASRASVLNTFADGLWHSITIIFTTNTSAAAGNNVTIFHNGVLDQTSQTSATAYAIPLIAAGMCQVAGTDTTTAPFAGSLNDVRIYSRAVTEWEILQYARQLNPVAAGLLVPPTMSTAQQRLRRRGVSQ